MKKSILIVEDEEFFRQLLSKKLLAADFNVLEAIDGKEGIEKIKEAKPDLVLLDLLLPKVDGFEVLSGAKSDPKTASIPIIILSNLGEEEDVERGMKLGAADYLIKSKSNMVDVIDKVKNLLEKK